MVCAPSLIRVFAVRMKKHWILSYPLSTLWRLIRLGGWQGWSESSLGAHHFVGFVMRWIISYPSREANLPLGSVLNSYYTRAGIPFNKHLSSSNEQWHQEIIFLFTSIFILSCSDLIDWLWWGLTSQSTILQSRRDGAAASWVINQYFWGVKCLAQGHNTAAVGFEPPTSRSGVQHSTTEPPRSPCSDLDVAYSRLYINSEHPCIKWMRSWWLNLQIHIYSSDNDII